MRPLAAFLALAAAAFAAPPTLTTTLVREGAPAGFHWNIPRVAAIGNAPSPREWLMTFVKRNATGGDVYKGIGFMTTSDAGATWSPLIELPYTARKMPNGLTAMFGAITPIYHPQSGKVLVVGNAVCYENYETAPKIAGPRYPAYAVYDPATKQWSADYTILEDGEGLNPTSGFPVVLPNGDFLWPANGGFVQKASFDGTKIAILSRGEMLTGRGNFAKNSGECHLARLGEKYYLAIRCADQNRLAVSADGQHFAAAVELRWDDGSLVPSAATQMHWITQRGRLYLVYTRQNDEGKKVFRTRAPLYLAEFDEQQLQLKKATEAVAVPVSPGEDDLGNFGAAVIGDELSVITTSEFGRKPASNSRVYLTRVTPPPF